MEGEVEGMISQKYKVVDKRKLPIWVELDTVFDGGLTNEELGMFVRIEALGQEGRLKEFLDVVNTNRNIHSVIDALRIKGYIKICDRSEV
ncbi:hypothetical protein D3C74_444900 [compost metagenome]